MASRPIDEKIVAMKMDNSDFIRKATQTTSMFSKLKASFSKITGISLNKTANEISSIGKAAGNVKLDQMANGVQNVTTRFSALQVAATTALATIANHATNAGLALAKSLSLDQVTAGFGEYETKINAIGTVLSNTEWAGTNLNDVNRVLDDLNTYADKTIYNFGQMTENIGRFTAAGVKIDDSATAIKGLSNLAAASGSDVNQLNTAMYQMSQAMAAGKLNLMDWNSMVNAGMGGKKTQDALVATAKAMGKNVDLTDGFRNSIEQGWLTSEVFLETLKKFGKDKSMIEAATKVKTFSGLMDTLKEGIGSGWATTFELIFGDFEQAGKLFTNLSNSIGGWFGDISKKRNDFIAGVAGAGGVKNIFSGIANAAKPVGQIFKALSDGFKRVFPPKTVYEVVKLTQNFKSFTAGLKLSKDSMSKLTTIFQGAFSVFSTVWEIAKQLGSAFMNLIPKGAGGGILTLMAGIAKLAIKFNESVKSGNFLTAAIQGLGKVLGFIGTAIGKTIGEATSFGSVLRNTIGKAVEWISSKLKPLGELLKDAFSGFNGSDALGAGGLVAIGLIVKKVFDVFNKLGGFMDSFKKSSGGLMDSFKGVFDSLGDSLGAFAQQVKYTNLMKIAVAVGILAVSLKILEGIDAKDIAKGIGALTTSLAVMMGGLAIIDKFSLTGGMQASTNLIAMALAVSIMAGALKKISDLKTDEIIRGVGALVGVTGALVGAIVAISKFGGKIKTSSIQLIALAGSIYILAGAVDKMSSIKAGDLAKSVSALGVIFAELALFLAVANKSKLSPTSAVGLIAVAGAIQIMVSAIGKIGKMDIPGLVKGLTTIGVILGQIVIFSKLVSGPTLLAAGAGLLLIAGAMNGLMVPIQQFANMTWEQLVKGLGAMAIALGAVAAAGMLMSGTLGGAVALTVMATALNLIAIPIQKFANMTWGELVKGFVGLAGGISLLAGISMLLTPAIVPMLGFGAALAVMGAAVLAAGVGIAAFGVGLTALATMTATSIAAIVASLGLLLTGFAKLIPAAVNFVVKLGISLLDGLGKLVPKLANTVAKIVLEILKTLNKYLPKFLKVGVDIIVNLMNGIGKHGPKLIQSALDLIIKLVNDLADGIRTNGPKILNAFMNVWAELLIIMVKTGIAVIDALFGWIPGVKTATAKIGKTAEDTIRKNFKADTAGKDKGKDFNKGLGGQSKGAKTAGKKIADAGKSGAKSVKMDATGKDFGQGFANGIAAKWKAVSDAASKIASAARDKIRKVLDMHSPSKVTTKDGGHAGQGFANGIAGKKSAVEKAASKIATAAHKAFNQKMGTADYRFKMGITNSKQYISELEKIKKSYSGYTDLVQKANLKIKRARENRVKAYDKAQKEHMNKINKQYKTDMDKFKYDVKMGKLDNSEQLKALKEIKKEYAKYPELVRKTNLEIKKVEDEISKKKIDDMKASIEEKKYYNKLSLADELKAWEAIVKATKKGSEERKNAEREVYRLKNEINDKLVELNNDYITKITDANAKLIEDTKALNDEYDNALADRIKSLTGFAGIFDKVNKDTEITGQELMDNLKGQVETFSQWTSNLQSLASKGLNSELLEELRDMGPQSAAQIAALNTLTEDELTEYASIWKTKNELATTEATNQLAQMRINTDAQIAELNRQTAVQLVEWQVQWEKSVKEIRTGTSKQFVGLKTDMKTVGRDTIKGMMNGLDSLTGDLYALVRSIAEGVSSTVKDTLGIHSPSRVLYGDGGHAGQGLINGILSKVKGVKQASKALAEGVLDTVSNVASAINLNDDNELHLKVVVDYDGIDPDKIKIPGIAITPDIDNVRRSVSEFNRRDADPQNGDTKDTKVDQSRVFSPKTYITAGASGREIARENEKSMRRLAYEFGV